MNVKELRKREKISQDKLARLLGVAVQTVRRWEKEVSLPSPMARRLIRELFQVEIQGKE